MKDTLVLTTSGLVPIQDVRLGDQVLTHKGRWRKVTGGASGMADTIIVRCNHYGIECSPQQKFLGGVIKRKYTKAAAEANGIEYTVEFSKCGVNVLDGEPRWKNACNLNKFAWGMPRRCEALLIPTPDTGSHPRHEFPALSAELFYFVGRWLGDGWVREKGPITGYNKMRECGEILISDSTDKEDEVLQTAYPLYQHPSVHRFETVSRISFYNIPLSKWLLQEFGKGAHGKKIPSWTFGMNVQWRRALLQGLMDSDGYKKSANRCIISSVSQNLMLGARLLAESLELRTTIQHNTQQYEHVLRGQKHLTPAVYVVSVSTPTQGNYRNDYAKFYNVRKIERGKPKQRVYRLRVEEDDSYTADLMSVHC